VRAFSSLTGRRVETESGLRLGTCHDLLGELTSSGVEVVALCVGRSGRWDRWGVRSSRHDEVDWSSVVRIEGDRIVVRDP
jgi:sporulation protein YlmC with PRC-barrel domain